MSAPTRPAPAGTDASPPPDAGFAARLLPLCVAMFGGFLSVGLPLPALPLFVTGRLGFGTAVAGLAVGLQSLATVLTRFPAGRAVDARGAKAVLSRGLLVAAVAGLVQASATAPVLPPVPALLVLLAGRLVLGVGESLLITGVLSWALDRAGPGRAGRAMSWNGMAQYGALALGAPAGFAAWHAGGFGLTALLATATPLLALAVVLPLPSAPVPAARTRIPPRRVLRHVLRPGLGLMAAGIGFAAVGAFGSLLFVRHGWPGAGLALSAYGGCFVLVRAVAGGWPDRFGGGRVAAGSMAVGTLGQLCLWLAADPVVALLGAALTGAGCSLVFPALGVEAFRPVPAESRGTAVGLFAAFQDIAIGLTGPVLGTLAAIGPAPAAPFAAGALAAFAGTLVALNLTPPDDTTSAR
ncbi:MAG: arabinose transporter [Gluconacetobacter diazotrophicus]|nr:arabinose transporter [Gluconacetobacter diazotrophicus]